MYIVKGDKVVNNVYIVIYKYGSLKYLHYVY